MSDIKVFHLEDGQVVGSTAAPAEPQFYSDVLLVHKFLDAFGAVPEAIDIPLVGLILEFLSSTTTDIVQNIYNPSTGSPGVWTDSASGLSATIYGILCTNDSTYLTPYYKDGVLYFPGLVIGQYYAKNYYEITSDTTSNVFENFDSRTFVFALDNSIYNLFVVSGGVTISIVKDIFTSIFNIKISVPAKDQAVSNGQYFPAGELSLTASFSPLGSFSIVSIRIEKNCSASVRINSKNVSLSSTWEYQYGFEETDNHDLGIDLSYNKKNFTMSVYPYADPIIIKDFFSYNRILSNTECDSLESYLASGL
jgi:hypothetical protein